ncbi:MAG: N,N-diacetylchitobiose phosphorylase [Actinomycetota bacterium]|nr:N,N-diacetylchitobiose phosphorylase [Actinomycetota bacterium]
MTSYGYFDDDAREYVVTRPDTPLSWINYLGSRLYGGIVTQNAGGYSFHRSGGTGRILRMRFNGVPVDQPGRYLYLRDDDSYLRDDVSGDYWSASWQPVGRPLSEDGGADGRYACTVRHGLGYSVFTARYAGITSEFTCFVPVGQAFEYWNLRVTNPGTTSRRVSVFSYAELANEWNYRQDLENLQYSQYVVRAGLEDGMIHRTNRTRHAVHSMFFGLAGAPVVSFDTDRQAFLGPYRTPASPQAVEAGRCGNTETVGDNACASLHTTVDLAPGESRDLVMILGVGHPSRAGEGLPSGRAILDEYGTPGRVAAELDLLRNGWADRLAPLQVRTPDPELNSMINVWHAYQTHMTFNWSRGVSLVEAGDRDGLGYRDTVQDMLSVAHSIPSEVRARLDLILTGQTAEGGGMPLVKPLTHTPGKESAPGVERYRSDDTLWLPLTVATFVYETGDPAYLGRVLPYADHGEATVLDHLLQALRFSLAHRGVHGLLQGLAADWNDCVHLGVTGESVFSTFLFHAAALRVAGLARLAGREEDAAWCDEQAAAIRAAANEAAWDGEWFVRGISADGVRLGSRSAAEGQIYLESNVWAVIGGATSRERGITCLDAVNARLATEHGLALLDPPHTTPQEGVELSLLVFPPGHKENGGIFCHSNAWAIVAETVLGRGDRAYEYYRSFLPARYNDQADVRQAEPYVYSQFTHGPASPRFGQSRNSWLTGTASWTYVAVTQYLLGITPVADGLRIEPCLPSTWDGFSARRLFRGHWLDITVTVSAGSGGSPGDPALSLTIDGTEVGGTVVPACLLTGGPGTTHTVALTLPARPPQGP